MRDGLFKRYFKIFVTTLLSCTTFLGVTVLLFSGVNYTSQRQSTLEIATQRGVDQADRIHNGSQFTYMAVHELLVSISRDLGVDAYVADETGAIIQCSESVCHHGDAAPKRAIKKIDKKGLYESGAYFEGFVGKDADYITGKALMVDGECVGYIFATSSIRPLFAYLGDTLFTYMFSVALMLLVAFAVIYTATLQLTTPLHEMSVAAEKFGKGDFSERVQVYGKDEIAVLARSFNEMADSLSEFENNRRSFVANVSHDLRTPMTTIGGYIDGILDGTIPADDEKKYLEIVSQEVKRLSRLTSSLLSVMKLEESRDDVELVSVDARAIIINILLNMEQRISEKKIFIPDLDIPDILYVKADKDMLHQVVYNLMDNAVKYTPVGGEIIIGVNADSAKTELSIRNSGNGIAPEEQASIFERFYKTDKSRGIDKTGTGLGLYIVKMLTKGMDGDVSVESDGESYTKFTVSLASAAVPKELIVVKQPSAEPVKGKRNFLRKMLDNMTKKDK